MGLVFAPQRQIQIRDALVNVYITLVIILGSAGFAVGISRFHADDSLKLGAYLILALAGSGMKIVLPGLDGTMSVNFFFVLVGMVELGTPETLIIGCLSVFLQYFWRAKNSFKLVQVAFNLSAVALAIFASCRVYETVWLKSLGLQFPLLLALAACTYFVLNTFVIAAIISLTGKQNILDVWRSSYWWTFPYYVSGAALAAGLHAITLRLGWQVSFLALPVVFLVYRTYRIYLDRIEAERKRLEVECRQAEEFKRHAEDVAKLHMRTIESLALAIDAKDQTTHSHLQRVKIYAVEVGKCLGLSENEINALRAASVLHDIGKLAVPEHIISKPGKLTPEEFEKMKIHPVVGAEILECVHFPYPVVPIVRCHHEKWDGSGYPAGLQGEEIPIGARIIAAVDCLDALASDRQYRRALPLPEAMAMVRKEAGKSFDPAVVDLLESRYVELERQARDAIQGSLKLSTDIKITRGGAPAAGFESAAETPEPAPKPVDSPQTDASDTLSPIISARVEIQRLLDASDALANGLTLEDVLTLAANRLKSVAQFDAIAFYSIRHDRLHPECVIGHDREAFSSLSIPVGEGLSGWVAQNNRPIVNGNPSVEFGYLNDPKKFSTLRSALSVPLSNDCGPTAVLTLYHSERDFFTRNQLKALSGLATKLGTLYERHARSAHAVENDNVDSITGLPNARSLFIHLEREVSGCLSEARNLSVLVCAVDNLQRMKDELGCPAADRLLKSFTSSLREACRPEDFLARIGGNEFVMVLPDLTEPGLSIVVNRFQTLVQDAAVHSGTDLSIRFGGAHLGADGTEPDQLITSAEQRLKTNPRGVASDRTSHTTAVLIPISTRVKQTRIA